MACRNPVKLGPPGAGSVANFPQLVELISNRPCIGSRLSRGSPQLRNFHSGFQSRSRVRASKHRMDSITHIALGAILGDAFAGKAIGKKAMVIGAVAQSLPDVDFIMSLWLRPVDNLLAHRGFTHSILFCVLTSLLLGILMTRWQHTSGIPIRKWMLFFVLQMFIHLFLDALNSYGVGWFEPFSHLRLAFDVIYVADPFYSVWLGVGCLGLLFLKTDSPKRKKWLVLSLMMSTLYLGYTFYNKVDITHDATLALRNAGIRHARFMTTPTPLNNWLWYVIAETDSGFQVGYRSVFDRTDSIAFTYFPRQDTLLKPMRESEDVQKLKRFSQGYYTVEWKNGDLLFNDLRFGQIVGWTDPHAGFAFHYDLLQPEANLFVVQQGRFSNWNGKTIRVLMRRIAGSPAQEGH